MSELKDISSLREKDPAFSDKDIREMVTALYIRMQECWEAKNLEELRPNLSDALYSKSDLQLDNYRKNGMTNKVEDPRVTEVAVRGWKSNDNVDSLIISLSTCITDYVVKDSDGSVVRGRKDAIKYMEYEWELIRSSDVKTESDAERKVEICPNCGAAVDVNRTAKCEYCGSIITVKEFGWVLNSIKGISQKTANK